MSNDDLPYGELVICLDPLLEIQMRLQPHALAGRQPDPLDLANFQALTRRSSPYFALLRGRVLPVLERWLPPESRTWRHP